jgi:WD40 repeat protein
MFKRNKLCQVFFPFILILLLFSACQPGQKNMELENDTQLKEIRTTTSVYLPTQTNTLSIVGTSTPTNTPTPELPPGLMPLIHEDLADISLSNVTDLVELASFGDGFLISIEISSDGSTAAAVFSTGVEVYDLETLELKSIFHTSMKFKRSHMDFLLSPNGKHFVLVKYDQIEVWQTDDGTLTHQIPLSSAYKEPKIIFSPDNRSFTIAEWGALHDKVFRLISMDDGDVIIEKDSTFKSSYSADGKHLAVIDTNEGDRVDIFNTAIGDIVLSFNGPKEAAALAFSPNESHLAVAYKNAVWVWDYQENILIRKLYGENSNKYHTNMTYSDDGEILVVESEFNPTGIKLWDMSTGDLLNNFHDHLFPVLSEDKNHLITFNRSTNQYYIWDLTTNTPLAKIEQGYFEEQVIYFLPDGKHVNIYFYERVYSDGLLPFTQYSLEDGAITIEKRPDPSSGVGILFFPRYNLNSVANKLITWPKNPFNFYGEISPASIVLRNPSDGSIIQSSELQLQPGWYQYVAMKERGIIHDLDNLFNGDLNIFIREIALGKYQLNDPKKSIYRRELSSPDGEKLVFQSTSDLVVLDQNNESEIGRRSFLGNIISFQFSVESDKIYLSYAPDGYNTYNESISIWDFNLDTNILIETYDARFHTSGGGWRYCNHRPLSISPDGKLLAFSGKNCAIQLVTADESNDLVCSFSPTVGSNGVMSFSPNSELIATAFSGGEIQIWNTNKCELVHTIYDHVDQFSDEPSINFAFSPDGTILGVSYGTWPEYMFGGPRMANFGHEGGIISFWGINK